MAKRFEYVSLRAMYHLMDGLTFKVSHCADVLDEALIEFNRQTGVPDRIVSWNARGGHARGPLALPGHGRIIVEITETFSPGRGPMQAARVVRKANETETAPVVFLLMRCPTLDVPMRVELPLRALLKGGPDLSDTYSAYLHALLCDDEQEFVYYGITKRGWSLRFAEHTKAGVAHGSRRLFPQELAALIEARVAERAGQNDTRPKLAGIVTALCAVGLDEDTALDVEEYLVDKYSLASKHPYGLNMIPGGRDGIRFLHQLAGHTCDAHLDTDSREAALDAHLERHPQLGYPQARHRRSVERSLLCGGSHLWPGQSAQRGSGSRDPVSGRDGLGYGRDQAACRRT
jgi:hypothetical protein